MIKKTIMITSIAVLVAVISVATMTMAQASPNGDDILITIEADAVPNFVSVTVVVDGSSESPGKGQQKVTLCHVDQETGEKITITVGAPAVPAHLAHGDTLGPCVE